MRLLIVSSLLNDTQCDGGLICLGIPE